MALNLTGRPRVDFLLKDQTNQRRSIPKGVSAIVIETERGEFSKPYLIRNFDIEFRKYFGGLPETWKTPKTTDGVLLAKRALDAGATLYVTRAEHYTDLTDKATGTSVQPSATVGGVLFTGVDYGDYYAKVTISDAVSGTVDKFDILCELPNSTVDPVTYYDFDKTVTTATALLFKNKVKFMTIGTGTISLGLLSTVTADLSGGDYAFDDLVDADYVGDTAGGTGIHAFDDTLGISYIAVPHKATSTIASGLATYVSNRKDMQAVLGTTIGASAEDIITYRDGTAIDTYLAQMWTGGLIINHPITGLEVQISEIGDVLGTFAKKDNLGNVWDSASGAKYPISNVLGVVKNFGTSARATDFDDLTNAGINCVINDPDMGVVLFGNRTLQKANTQLQKANVASLVVYLFKQLRVIAKFEQFKANDIPTWRTIYNNTSKILVDCQNKQGIVSGTNGWLYDGDQFVDSISDCEINDPADIQNGTYQYNLYFKPISSLEYVQINAIVTSTGVDLTLI